MISEIHTQYGSFVRRHGKSLAFAAYHLTKAEAIRLILRVSKRGKSDVLNNSGQSVIIWHPRPPLSPSKCK
jgi:hypothetical protein